MAANPESLARILHDDLVYRHSDGRAETKDELIATLTGDAVDYREIRVNEIVQITCVDGATHRLGALQTLEVTFEGREFTVPNCYLASYATQAGRLQLATYQSAPLGEKGECPLW